MVITPPQPRKVFQVLITQNATLLDTLQISVLDIEKMAKMSSGFRSMLIGTSAEMQLTRLLGTNSQLAFFEKNPDLDRAKRSDFTITYKGTPFRMELKSENVDGLVKLKTSDSVTYKREDGSYTTTALPTDRFDILAVSLFNRGKGWSFAFVEADDIARTRHKVIPEQYVGEYFASSIDLNDYDDVATSDPFTLFERIMQRNASQAA